MSFRIWTIFWVIAIVASAVATFGPEGTLAAIIVVAFWALIFYGSTRLSSPTGLLFVVVFIAAAVAILLTVLQTRSESSASDECEINLGQITDALKDHCDRFGSFPPAYSVDPNGKPLFSWRVSVLPPLEEEALYSQFDLKKAWDDPVNRNGSATPLEDFKCPTHFLPGPTADYLAIIGAETAWPFDKPRNLRDFQNKLSQTILLVEACGRHINWAEPRDLSFEEAVNLLATSLAKGDGHHVENGFLFKPSSGRFVAFADGRVAILSQPIDRNLAKSLLTVGGSDQIPAGELAAITHPQIDWAKCYALAAFIVISLLPAVRLMRRSSDKKN
jgi:hypothetical protein